MTGLENPRLLAIDAISGVLDRRRNLDEVPALSSADADPRDLSFARHLAYGVLRWLTALEWIAGELLERPLKRRDRDIHRLILLGLFELWKDGSADHAAVNETAECARRVGKPWAVGVVNAVLRRFQREKSDLAARLEARIERFAHPAWLTERIRADWPEQWEAILQGNNQPGDLWLRVNRSTTGVDAVSRALESEGFQIERHPFASHALKVSPAAPVEELPGYDEGLWSVQDPAAQLAVDWLTPQAGHHVLDACAAPGGKTCQILETVRDVRLTALDRSPDRLERLKENTARLRLNGPASPKVICGDALEIESWWDCVPFDRILLDAPCTATGVIRRHPEIKWLRTEEQVDEAVATQARILRHLWPLLKAGGILVYATCSILRDENDRQISLFLKDHQDAKPEAPDAEYGHDHGTGRQVLPGESGMDGFFYARLRKSS